MPNRDETSKKIELLHSRVEKLLMKKYTDVEIITELENDGIDSDYTQTIIENVRDDQDDRKSFRSSMIMGLFYIGAGFLINYLSYKIAASSNSLFFYLFWGVLVLGIVTIVRGFILYRK